MTASWAAEAFAPGAPSRTSPVARGFMGALINAVRTRTSRRALAALVPTLAAP